MRKLRYSLINLCNNKERSVADKAHKSLVVVDFMLYAGFSQAAIRRLSLRDFDSDANGRLWVTTGDLRIKLPITLAESLLKYLAWEQISLPVNDNDKDAGKRPLLLNRKGMRIEGNSMQHLLNGVLVGDFSDYGPDDLRRTCALNLLQVGESVPNVLALFQCSKKESLERFLGIDIETIELPSIADLPAYGPPDLKA